MKTLAPITVGTYTVAVTAEAAGTHQVLLKATCSGQTAEHKICPQCPHDHTDAQYAKDLQNAANLVATECAGKARAADLRTKFLAP